MARYNQEREAAARAAHAAAIASAAASTDASTTSSATRSSNGGDTPSAPDAPSLPAIAAAAGEVAPPPAAPAPSMAPPAPPSQHQPNTPKQPWELVDELLNILKTGFPLLALSMEKMVDQIQTRGKSSTPEDIYRFITALLMEGIQQYIYRSDKRGDTGKITPQIKEAITRFAQNVKSQSNDVRVRTLSPLFRSPRSNSPLTRFGLPLASTETVRGRLHARVEPARLCGQAAEVAGPVRDHARPTAEEAAARPGPLLPVRVPPRKVRRGRDPRPVPPARGQQQRLCKDCPVLADGRARTRERVLLPQDHHARTRRKPPHLLRPAPCSAPHSTVRSSPFKLRSRSRFPS